MKNWFVDWFSSEEYLTVYNHRNEADAKQLINLILTQTNIKPPARILDAACGNGRHSIVFAKKGFEVDAFDLSETLLAIAKENSQKEKLKINFYKSDIRKFCIENNYDLICNLFTSFGYFESDSENFAFFSNAFKMLGKTGVFVFDYFNKDYLINNLIAESSKKINDLNIKEIRYIKNERVVKKITIQKQNEKKIYFESVKLYDVETLSNVLKKIGFTINNIFGDYFGNKFEKENSKRLIYFLSK